jgi:hypothetical protein
VKFRKLDQYAAESDCGLFVINLANTGDTVCYTAVRRGNGTGPEILHVERDLPADKDHPDRVAGFRACVAACEAHEEKAHVR